MKDTETKVAKDDAWPIHWCIRFIRPDEGIQ